MSSTLRLTHDAAFLIRDDAVELFVRLAAQEGTDIINVTLTDGAAFFFERQGYIFHYANEPTVVTPGVRTVLAAAKSTAISAEDKAEQEGDLRPNHDDLKWGEDVPLYPSNPTGMLTLVSSPVK